MESRIPHKLVLAITVVVSGCVRPVAESPALTSPLSVAEWRGLPVRNKYDENTFRRLKLNDPRLQQEQHWAQFMKDTVLPERRQDLPGDFPE